MSAINPANNSSNTHSPGSLTWSLTSLLHTFIHPHRSSHSLLPASFYVIIQIRGASRRQRLYSLQPRLALHSPLHPDSVICSQHIPHTSTCKYPFIGRYHLYNTVHYIKKIIMLICTSCPWDPYTHLSAFLILFVCSRLLACVAVHILACSYHHHSFPAFFHSFTVLALCVYFLRVVLSGLSPVVCLFLIGPRQRDICSAVLVLRNLQITEYFVPDLN